MNNISRFRARLNSTKEAAKNNEMSRVIYQIALVAAALAAGTVADPATAQTPYAAHPVRMDKQPLGPGEFCLVKLNNGPVLKMPKSLFSEGTCETQKPTPARRVGFTFWYPDMIRTNWPGELRMDFEKHEGTYVPQVDRFRVWIVFLFAPSQIKDATYQDWDGEEPQVWQIIESSRLAATSYPQPKYSKSKVPGFREIHFGKALPPSAALLEEAKKKGWDFSFETHAYAELPENDYSMLLDCNGSLTCMGHVQLNKNHLQYRIYIPTESMPNAAAAISATNKMINAWVQ